MLGLAWHALSAAQTALDVSPRTETSAARVVASVGEARYTSEEPMPDGRLFNREHGPLRRMGLSLHLEGQDWGVTAALRQARGVIDYDGQTQLGLPLVTQTDLARREWSLAVERHWHPCAEGWVFTVGAGAEALRTARAIRATPISSALTETLSTRQWALRGGAGFTTALVNNPLRVGAMLQWSRPWRHALVVDTQGLVDPFELRPVKRWGGRAGLTAAMAVGADFEAGVDLGWESYRPGAGALQPVYRDGLPVGGASYPGSVQTIRHIAATLTWRL